MNLRSGGVSKGISRVLAPVLVAALLLVIMRERHSDRASDEIPSGGSPGMRSDRLQKNQHSGRRPAQSRRESHFVPGQILVQLRRTGTTSKALMNAAGSRLGKTLGATKVETADPSTGLIQVNLSENDTVENAILRAKADSGVISAQPNYIYHISEIAAKSPNDPFYSQLWGLRNTGQTIVRQGDLSQPFRSGNPGTSGADISMEKAWGISTDCSNTIVAVLDTGVNYLQEDLADNVVFGPAEKSQLSFFRGGWDPMDENGHGTHVAGTIGAVGSNGIGSTGICWKAKILPIKVLGPEGSGNTRAIARGIRAAVDYGAKVINASFGGGSYDAYLESAISYARDHGVLFVAAAGNSGLSNDYEEMVYPCNYDLDNILCVAALDQRGELAWFSNYGKSRVHVAAPGVNIVSTWYGIYEPVMQEDFSGGWEFYSRQGPSWSVQSLDLEGQKKNYLTFPSGWDGKKLYGENVEARAAKFYRLPGLLNLGRMPGYYQAGYRIRTHTRYSFADLESNTTWDQVHICLYYWNSASWSVQDPSKWPSSVYSVCETGIRGDSYESFEDFQSGVSWFAPTDDVDIALVFQFSSDAANSSTGIALTDFTVERPRFDVPNYNVLAGTSMATPHVSGVAGMLFSNNPNYNYLDVINAIKAGGVPDSRLTAKLKWGKSLNAYGAMSVIQAPTNLTAQMAR